MNGRTVFRDAEQCFAVCDARAGFGGVVFARVGESSGEGSGSVDDLKTGMVVVMVVVDDCGGCLMVV